MALVAGSAIGERVAATGRSCSGDIYERSHTRRHPQGLRFEKSRARASLGRNEAGRTISAGFPWRLVRRDRSRAAQLRRHPRPKIRIEALWQQQRPGRLDHDVAACDRPTDRAGQWAPTAVHPEALRRSGVDSEKRALSRRDLTTGVPQRNRPRPPLEARRATDPSLPSPTGADAMSISCSRSGRVGQPFVCPSGCRSASLAP